MFHNGLRRPGWPESPDGSACSTTSSHSGGRAISEACTCRTCVENVMDPQHHQSCVTPSGWKVALPHLVVAAPGTAAHDATLHRSFIRAFSELLHCAEHGKEQDRVRIIKGAFGPCLQYNLDGEVCDLTLSQIAAIAAKDVASRIRNLHSSGSTSSMLLCASRCSALHWQPAPGEWARRFAPCSSPLSRPPPTQTCPPPTLTTRCPSSSTNAPSFP